MAINFKELSLSTYFISCFRHFKNSKYFDVVGLYSGFNLHFAVHMSMYILELLAITCNRWRNELYAMFAPNLSKKWEDLEKNAVFQKKVLQVNWEDVLQITLDTLHSRYKPRTYQWSII